jgi:hypothetical protein
MIIAIMSDSHDHIWNVRKALAVLRSRGVDAIIHCGDLIAPFTLRELAAFEGPVHWVLGNNDGDPFMLTKISLTELNNTEPHGIIGRLSLDGVSIAVTHHEEIGVALAHTKEHDLVCCGHTHVYRQEQIKDTMLLNPGDLMGKDGPGSFCLFDTAARGIELVKLA